LKRTTIRHTFVGIDVSANKLDVAWITLEGKILEFVLPNTANGHQDLIRRISSAKTVRARVCIEATGAYSIDLHQALHDAPRIEVMVARPMAVRDFTRSLGNRAKTDKIDAKAIAEFCKRMDFRPSPPPVRELYELRALSRRLDDLVGRQTAIKNRIHAAQATRRTPAEVLDSLNSELVFVAGEIARVESLIIAALNKHDATAKLVERIKDIKGFGERAIAHILPEVLALPKELTAKSVTAHAGLDPKPRQSGSSLNPKSWGISRMGNAHLRAALFMPAMAAVRHLPEAKAFHARVSERSGCKMVGIVAVMRKLLTAIWSMYVRDEPFAPEKFARAA